MHVAPAGHCIPPHGAPELDELLLVLVLLLELPVDIPPAPPLPGGVNWSKSRVQPIKRIAGKMKRIGDVFSIRPNQHSAAVSSSADKKMCPMPRWVTMEIVNGLCTDHCRQDCPAWDGHKALSDPWV